MIQKKHEVEMTSLVQGASFGIEILFNKVTGEILLYIPDKNLTFGWPLEGALDFRDKLDSVIKKAQQALGLEA